MKQKRKILLVLEMKNGNNIINIYMDDFSNVI